MVDTSFSESDFSQFKSEVGYQNINRSINNSFYDIMKLIDLMGKTFTSLANVPTGTQPEVNLDVIGVKIKAKKSKGDTTRLVPVKKK